MRPRSKTITKPKPKKRTFTDLEARLENRYRAEVAKVNRKEAERVQNPVVLTERDILPSLRLSSPFSPDPLTPVKREPSRQVVYSEGSAVMERDESHVYDLSPPKESQEELMTESNYAQVIRLPLLPEPISRLMGPTFNRYERRVNDLMELGYSEIQAKHMTPYYL